MSINIKEWYGAKTVYQVSSNTVTGTAKLYEERIVIIKAASLDDAIAKAEEEAMVYAEEGSGLSYLGYVNVFKLFTDKILNKSEVYSLMRESNLTPSKYLDKYFDTGKERTKHQ